MRWMLMPYRRYFDFSGRSQRMEFWMFSLFFAMVIVAFMVVVAAGMATARFQTSQQPGAGFWVGIVALTLFVLGSIIPSIAVTVRRFHDQNLSGWMYLIHFIPYIGGIVIIVFMCIEGTKGDNAYGPDPKGRGIAGVFD